MNTCFASQHRLTAGRTVKWTKNEDIKLKKAVQMHGGKDWAAVLDLRIA
jgi:hypothetical protein